MTLASRGEHIKHQRLFMRKLNQLISHPTEMQLNVDGEYGGKLPANFLNLKDISVCTPKDIYNEELTEDRQVEDGIIEEAIE